MASSCNLWCSLGCNSNGIANFDMYGQDTFQAFQTMAVVAQMGAAFGYS